MFRKRILAAIAFTIFSIPFAVLEIQAQVSTTFIAGLRSPQKIIYAQQQRYFLVSESGIPGLPNSGRISIITNDGDRFTLIDGLPSGAAAPEGHPSGPSAMWMQGTNLYIAISGGNTTLVGLLPGSEIPNPNPSPPIFSSVLEFRFPAQGFRINRADYDLTSADHLRLANGETVVLGRFGFQRARGSG